MNEDLKNNKPSTDEVDLGQLFNAIGRLFDRFFKFIGSILKGVFSFIIFILKVIIDNFKLISAVMVIAFISGYALEKTRPAVYTSQILVRPYFDSKFQLVNNINYFNTLIATQDHKELSNVFEISEENSKELRSFEVKPGPESENEKVKAYADFLKSIDTASARSFTYIEFIENRNIYSGNLFEINVESTKKDIFRSLESGLNNAFKNTYSERQKEKRDTLLEIEKSSILASLTSIDTLRNVYLTVLKEDSKRGSTKISFGEGLSLEPEGNSKTREIELLNREIRFRDELTRLEELKVRNDTFFDVVSGFQDVGRETREFGKKYKIIFPLLGLIMLSIIFTIIRLIKFIRHYEG